MVLKNNDQLIRKRNKLFTRNPEQCNGISVYGEQLKTINGSQYRSWNPYRSKLAAALLKKKFTLSLPENSTVLYLGAATGTTVSHLSDLISNGTIYAVEHSPISMKKLLSVVEPRQNIIPLFEDANHPDRYFSIVPQVDLVYQDISQRNQSDIFIRNMNMYLKPGGTGIIMVKARSIDVSLPPKKAYRIVEHELRDQDVTIHQSFSLSPFEKDHAAFVLQKQG
ncbi:MAG: fibrillarin-like rRNA/tRNA 2'-O-methyltransferase [Candidatus Thermoplasmatota archaeon]|nr:fibrillarin-like rRNA/tRNA 2'-O-methyltransferase [Candidatus Thermoplasmatota archaeon]MBS3801866.1 fibrillarin-like rRNA/tRNA 2'-O-methyltransferase [Candidatus Thermoplasmatota archaeon]